MPPVIMTSNAPSATIIGIVHSCTSTCTLRTLTKCCSSPLTPMRTVKSATTATSPRTGPDSAAAMDPADRESLGELISLHFGGWSLSWVQRLHHAAALLERGVE